MISIAFPSLPMAVASPASRMATCQLSIACASTVDKLNNILEEHRKTNYTQEMPRQFHKDIVKVAANMTSRQLNSSTNAVSDSSIEHILNNIGAGHRMSRWKFNPLLVRSGHVRYGAEDYCVITADQMLDLISTNWAEHHQELNQ